MGSSLDSFDRDELKKAEFYTKEIIKADMEGHRALSDMKNNPKALIDIHTNVRNDISHIKSNTTEQGIIYNFLADKIDFLEETKFRSTYEITGDLEDIEIFLERLDVYESALMNPRHSPFDETALIGFLQVFDITKGEEIDDDPFFPSSGTYKRNFGSWNNALWRAGKQTKNQKYDRDILIEMLLDKYYKINKDVEQFDSLQDVTNRDIRQDDSMPSPIPYEEHFGSLKNAKWMAGLESEKENVDKDITHEKLLQKVFENEEHIPKREELLETTSITNWALKKAGNYEQVIEECGLETYRNVQQKFENEEYSETDYINEYRSEE